MTTDTSNSISRPNSRERDVTASGEWYEMVDGKWTADGEPAPLRAKIGAQRISVWLPSGKRVVFRYGGRDGVPEAWPIKRTYRWRSLTTREFRKIVVSIPATRPTAPEPHP